MATATAFLCNSHTAHDTMPSSSPHNNPPIQTVYTVQTTNTRGCLNVGRHIRNPPGIWSTKRFCARTSREVEEWNGRSKSLWRHQGADHKQHHIHHTGCSITQHTTHLHATTHQSKLCIQTTHTGGCLTIPSPIALRIESTIQRRGVTHTNSIYVVSGEFYTLVSPPSLVGKEVCMLVFCSLFRRWRSTL